MPEELPLLRFSYDLGKVEMGYSIILEGDILFEGGVLCVGFGWGPPLVKEKGVYFPHVLPCGLPEGNMGFLGFVPYGGYQFNIDVM